MSKSVLILGGRGYIGSELYSFLHTHGYDCLSVDLDIFKPSRLKHELLPNLRFNYATELRTGFISQFDNVILLAGHSSVPSCDLNQEASFKNNVTNFQSLVDYGLTFRQKFIYASSASVYGSVLDAKEDKKILFNPHARYDTHKRMVDEFILNSTRIPKWYGLRFGTVCGHSANPRNELLINSMVRDSLTKGVVNISSPNSWRAVLGMVDLCRSVKHILDNNLTPGYYNLASFNMPIGNLGEQIARHFEAKCLINNDITSPYSFSMDTSKIRETGFEFIESPKLIAERVRFNDFSINRDWSLLNNV